MEQLTEDVFMISQSLNHGFNQYVIEDVLVDGGTKRAGRKILRELEGREIRAHVVTHGHSDHQGSSRTICDALEIPLWCGEADARILETGDLQAGLPDTVLSRRVLDPLGRLFWAGPPCPVTRRLREGDEVGSFRVIETPGHTAGHISLWREQDRTLILGDVLMNFRWLGGRPGLVGPLAFDSLDLAQARASARKVAELEPALVCFGHGPPLRDPAKLRAYVDQLPE